MKNLRNVLFVAMLLLIPLAGLQAANTQAELLLDAGSARPGTTIMAGVQLTMDDGWHTYWRYGGDSGAPTEIEWTLPEGITAGEIQWPVPQIHEELGFITFVYYEQTMLLVPLTISEDFEHGQYTLKAKVDWLECEKVCIPASANVEAFLTVSSVSTDSESKPLIEEWQTRVPQPDPSFAGTAIWDGPALEGQDERNLIIELPETTEAVNYDFLPHYAENYDVSAKTETLPVADGTVRLRKSMILWEGEWPERIQGLVAEKGDAGNILNAVEVDLALTEFDGPERAGVSAARNNAAELPSAGLAKMLLFAFLGGMILNIMPCVLPVISLKILSFVRQSSEAPGHVRKLGLIYTLGVLVSFLALAAMVIAVKSAGNLAGWGMQFSNPYFVVLMIVLVTLVALNLFGLFEITLGGKAMQAAGEASSREGKGGAFFSGVLATALATPCTAPFLGIAVGFAVRQPSAMIVLMFLIMGAGLALPYLVLSLNPAWLKFLPKPGAWMEKFKIAMGFPMIATAIWLSSILTRHYGQDGVLWVGMFLVVLAMTAWIWGAFVQHGKTQRGFAAALSIALIGGGYWFALERQLEWRTKRDTTTFMAQIDNQPDGVQWRVWSPDAVIQARREGHPVLVNFTADWCLTCQVNVKPALENAKVVEKLSEINAVAFEADNTLLPPAIVEELYKYDRAGVPLVLIFPADPEKEPFVLPEILTPSLVLEKLNAAVDNS